MLLNNSFPTLLIATAPKRCGSDCYLCLNLVQPSSHSSVPPLNPRQAGCHPRAVPHSHSPLLALGMPPWGFPRPPCSDHSQHCHLGHADGVSQAQAGWHKGASCWTRPPGSARSPLWWLGPASSRLFPSGHKVHQRPPKSCRTKAGFQQSLLVASPKGLLLLSAWDHVRPGHRNGAETPI